MVEFGSLSMRRRSDSLYWSKYPESMGVRSDFSLRLRGYTCGVNVPSLLESAVLISSWLLLVRTRRATSLQLSALMSSGYLSVGRWLVFTPTA